MSDDGGRARRYGGDGSRADGGGVVQRAPGRRTLAQARYPMQRRAAARPAAPSEHGGAATRSEGGGLPAGLQRGVEALSGVSMEGVQVHRDSDRPAELGALAFAQGRDIHLGPGQEAQLPHEAWHVAQQAQGRVQATTQLAGSSVNDDDGLEHEADVMGAKALAQGEQPDGAAREPARATAPTGPAPVQGKFIGPLARDLMDINVGLIDPGNQTFFAAFRKELDDHATEITVYQGPDTSYQPGTKALSLHRTLLSDLAAFARQQLYGNKPGVLPVAGADVVSQLSTVAHELSHARDHVIKGKAITANIDAVIDTELRAWAIEAMDAHTVGKAVKDMDKAKQKLIDGWVAIKPAMLDDLAAHAATNEVAARLLRYIIRELKSDKPLVINGWCRMNRDTLDPQLLQLQGVVARKLGIPTGDEKVRVAWMTWADEAAGLFLKGDGVHAPAGHKETIVGSFKDKHSFAQPTSEAFKRTAGLVPDGGAARVTDFIHAHDAWLTEAVTRFYGKLPCGIGGADWSD